MGSEIVNQDGVFAIVAAPPLEVLYIVASVEVGRFAISTFRLPGARATPINFDGNGSPRLMLLSKDGMASSFNSVDVTEVGPSALVEEGAVVSSFQDQIAESLKIVSLSWLGDRSNFGDGTVFLAIVRCLRCGSFASLGMPLEEAIDVLDFPLALELDVALEMRGLFFLANFASVYEVGTLFLGELQKDFLIGIVVVVERKTEVSKSWS